MKGQNQKYWGIVAEFKSPGDLVEAARKVYAAGIRKYDTMSPFPIHGMDAAMGLPDTKLPWIVLVCAFLGGSGALLMQWWMSAVDYKIIVGGKPYFSFQAFVPVTFELTILLSAFGAFFGTWALCGLPQLFHPLFSYPRFRKFSDDGFFLAVEARDPNFDPERTRKLLEEIGGQHIALVEA